MSASTVRPKRGGEDFTRTHHLQEGEPSAKKPRFDPRNPSQLAPDAQEDDPVLDADEIGSRTRVKRSAVNIDGYDSDSSTENFDIRAAANAKAKKQVDPVEDEDDDMFAQEDDNAKSDDDEEFRKKKKKPVRFLDDHEIVGQEDSSKSKGHIDVDFGGSRMRDDTDEDYSTSDSDDEEKRDMMDPDMDEEIGAGGKKRHAPRIDAFNMKAEQEEGRFDEAGNYVRKAYDPEAKYDNWMEGQTSRKKIKAAKAASDKRQADLKERQEEEKKRLREEDAIATSDILAKLIRLLQPSETPYEALPRLQKSVIKKQPKRFNSNRKNAPMDVDPDPDKQAASERAHAAIKDIIECVDRLERRRFDKVSDESREMLTRHYQKETGEQWKDAKEYEFHYLGAPEEVHGPYDGKTIRAWLEHGQIHAGQAEFRQVGDEDWSTTLDFA